METNAGPGFQDLRPLGWSPWSLLSDLFQQGVECFFICERILTDMAVRQNASLLNALRDPLAAMFPVGNQVLAELAAEGISNAIELQTILLNLAQRQNEIVMTGLKRTVPGSMAAAVVDVLRRGADTFIETQQLLLSTAARQTRACQEAVRTGRPVRGVGLTKLAGETVDHFVRSGKTLLKVLSEAAARDGASPPDPKVTDLARESAHSFVDSQRRLLDLARRQVDATARAARRKLGFTMPELDPMDLVIGVEFMLLHTSPVYYGFGVPRGDNSAVVLVPGFLITDLYLMELYSWLRRIGYRPYFSDIGMNAECPNLLVRNRLIPTLERARRETAGPVHLVGHSLGGMMARAVAAQRPADVASVITLASPMLGAQVHSSGLRAAEAVRRHILLQHGPDVLDECYTGHCCCELVSCLRSGVPESVPQTAIYTRTDHVVDWRACLTQNPAANFEVPGTHGGLAFNPFVYSIVGTRLAASRPPKPDPDKMRS